MDYNCYYCNDISCLDSLVQCKCESDCHQFCYSCVETKCNHKYEYNSNIANFELLCCDLCCTEKHIKCNSYLQEYINEIKDRVIHKLTCCKKKKKYSLEDIHNSFDEVRNQEKF